jgi:ABC-type antimicrobial peptide transport system permease subunit
VEAIVRLNSFRDVLPARRALEAALGEELEIEPKGGQVVALERFESISDAMEYGYLAMQITYAVSLMFIIGITAYMHVMSKTSDIGILRSYGLSPRSIGAVYTLELAMIMIPACLLGILAAVSLARASNDWVAETVVLTAGPDTASEASGSASASLRAAQPKVFLSLQQGAGAILRESARTVGLAGVILAAVTGMSVWLIKRQQIVDSLRSGTG